MGLKKLFVNVYIFCPSPIDSQLYAILAAGTLSLLSGPLAWLVKLQTVEIKHYTHEHDLLVLYSSPVKFLNDTKPESEQWYSSSVLSTLNQAWLKLCQESTHALNLITASGWQQVEIHSVNCANVCVCFSHQRPNGDSEGTLKPFPDHRLEHWI